VLFRYTQRCLLQHELYASSISSSMLTMMPYATIWGKEHVSGADE
jgi:hypothetical protein